MVSASLKIWVPEPDRPIAPTFGTETVSQLFLQVTLPQLEELGRSKDTIGEYRTHVRRWQEFWADGGPSSKLLTGPDKVSGPLAELPPGEPLAREILRDWLVAFRRWVTKHCLVSPRSANKHVSSIQAILKCGSESGRFQNFPRAKRLPEKRRRSRLYLQMEQVSALYLKADAALWPVNEITRGSRVEKPLPYPSADYWRANFVLYFNYGFRTQETWRYESDHEALRWENVCWGVQSPSDEGIADCKHGWIWYVPQKQDWIKDEPLVLPMNAVVREHLLSIYPPGAKPSDLIFPAGKTKDDFYETWKLILNAAGIRPRASIKGEDRKFHLYHFRKTCATWHDRNRPGISARILGHAERDADEQTSAITERHYVNPEMALIDALETLPQPEAFYQIFDRKQRRLFS